MLGTNTLTSLIRFIIYHGRNFSYYRGLFHDNFLMFVTHPKLECLFLTEFLNKAGANPTLEHLN
jgi:hypothetical protein